MQTPNQVVMYRKQHVEIKGPCSRQMRPDVFINKLSILIISLNICVGNLGVKIWCIILTSGTLLLCLVCYKLVIFGCQICSWQGAMAKVKTHIRTWAKNTWVGYQESTPIDVTQSKANVEMPL
jgi:hypothetical protein